MGYASGTQVVIIDRSPEGQSTNNSIILVLQSEEKWTTLDIHNLKRQLLPNQQLIVLPDGTNVVQIHQAEDQKQEERTSITASALDAIGRLYK